MPRTKNRPIPCASRQLLTRGVYEIPVIPDEGDETWIQLVAITASHKALHKMSVRPGDDYEDVVAQLFAVLDALDPCP